MGGGGGLQLLKYSIMGFMSNSCSIQTRETVERKGGLDLAAGPVCLFAVHGVSQIDRIGTGVSYRKGKRRGRELATALHNDATISAKAFLLHCLL